MSAGNRKSKRKPRPPKEGRPKRSGKGCQTGKIGYVSEGDAVLATASYSRKKSCRPYRCPSCGNWHLTTQRKHGAPDV